VIVSTKGYLNGGSPCVWVLESNRPGRGAEDQDESRDRLPEVVRHSS
jgi:hypothetical protein